MKISIQDKEINLNLGLPGGFLGLLTVIFLLLKVFDYTDWWWGWVFAPIWIPLALVGIVLGFVILVLFIAARKFW